MQKVLNDMKLKTNSTGEETEDETKAKLFLYSAVSYSIASIAVSLLQTACTVC